MKKFLLYCRKYWKVIVGVFILLFSLIGILYFKNDLKEYSIKRKKISMGKKKRELELLQIKKDIVDSQIGYTEEAIWEIDKDIQRINESIEKDMEDIANLTMNQKLDKFDELGY